MVHSLNGMAERYREMLAAPEFIELIGCHDTLSAVISEASGFRAVFLSGFGAAASVFGTPDIGLTTLSETSFLARNMIPRLRVPVIVDIDNGYGSEDNVIRTISEMESAGAAGIVLEDQILPKRCGHSEHKAVVPLDQYLRKLDFALKSRKTPLVVVARTDASPVEEAILRARAFYAAGADLTLVDGVRSEEDLKRIAEEVPGPKQVNLIYGGKTPLASAPELYRRGFKVILYSTPTLFLMTRALTQGMARLQATHDLRSLSEASSNFSEFQSFIEKLYLLRTRGEK